MKRTSLVYLKGALLTYKLFQELFAMVPKKKECRNATCHQKKEKPTRGPIGVLSTQLNYQ